MIRIGDRVGAILGSDKESGVIKFLGFGTFLGEVVPDTDDVKFFGMSLKQLNRVNPCILLENGTKVYGAECWWGAEERVKEILSTAKEIKIVAIDEVRKGI